MRLAMLAIAVVAFVCGGPDTPLEEASAAEPRADGGAAEEREIRDGVEGERPFERDGERARDEPPEGERGGPPEGEEDHGDKPKGPQFGEPGGPPFEGAPEGEARLPGLAEGEEPLEGELLGKVVDAEGKDLAGAKVEVVGSDASDLSDAQGLFRVPGPTTGLPVLRVTRDGYQTLVSVGAGPEGEHREIRVELVTSADEAASFQEAHGAPIDPKKGSVFVHVDAGPKVLAGLAASLDAPGATPWVYDAKDAMIQAGAVIEGASSSEFVFPDVGAGTHTLTLPPPAGWSCDGATFVPVEAGAFSAVFWRCGPV